METQREPRDGPVTRFQRHALDYPRFLWRILVAATDGSRQFYTWMFTLTVICLIGANAWAHQVAGGMITTHMTDHVSWGLYIANFTFAVGLAAGGVMMVIPAYLYDDRNMHDVVIVGEIVAVAAILMALAFVNVDIGRPERVWHLLPGVGRFNWPMSMLTWDVIVLTIYLFLNLHVIGYVLYCRDSGRPLRKRWYVPFVMLSIIWAFSIHTVTAFLYSGLGGRPFWNSGLLAPRFLASAFVTGPAFIAVILMLLKLYTRFRIPSGAIITLVKIMRVTILLNLFMMGSELFSEFYTGGSHAAAAEYLFFGIGENTALVPWIWTALCLNVFSGIVLLRPVALRSPGWLIIGCTSAFTGIWIEKGMGLIVPAFVPSTLHEVVEYTPSMTEWKVTWGIWAMGLMVITIGLKVALPIISKSLHSTSGTGGVE